MCMLMADRSISTFDFVNEKLMTGLSTPKIIQEVTNEVSGKLAGQAGSLANKFSKGAKLYDLVN